MCHVKQNGTDSTAENEFANREKDSSQMGRLLNDFLTVLMKEEESARRIGDKRLVYSDRSSPKPSSDDDFESYDTTLCHSISEPMKAVCNGAETKRYKQFTHNEYTNFVLEHIDLDQMVSGMITPRYWELDESVIQEFARSPSISFNIKSTPKTYTSQPNRRRFK